jgi:hypothetical protein
MPVFFVIMLVSLPSAAYSPPLSALRPLWTLETAAWCSVYLVDGRGDDQELGCLGIRIDLFPSASFVCTFTTTAHPPQLTQQPWCPL